MIEDALMHFDGTRYRLLSWCIMPNHVHVVIEIVDEYSLTGIVGSWKSAIWPVQSTMSSTIPSKRDW